MVVDLPMLVRGHAINSRVLEDIITLRVVNLYQLNLGLPKAVEESECKSFFDCKLRKLVTVLPIKLQEDVEQLIEKVPEI